MNDQQRTREDLLAEISRLKRELADLSVIRASECRNGRIPGIDKLAAAGEITTIVSHRFNGLLMVILSAADFIRDSLSLNSQAYRDVEDLLKATREAIGLTRQLRAFSRQEKLALEPTNLNELVQGMHEMLKRLAGPRIEVRLLMAPTGVTALADRGHIHEVVKQLVANAAEAMPDGGRLAVGTAMVMADRDEPVSDLGSGDSISGTFAMLTVSDSGPGIPPDIIGRILHPFVTTKGDAAQGLGLSATYGVVRQHDGYLACRQGVDGGAEFQVYLPAADPEPKAAVSGAPVPRPANAVLLVEDEENVRRMIARGLVGMGYEVIQAVSAEEALASLAERHHEIGLVLTDVGLPGMDGKALADEIDRMYPGLAVILASGYPGDLLEARGIGKRTGILMKPFTQAELAERIKEALA